MHSFAGMIQVISLSEIPCNGLLSLVFPEHIYTCLNALAREGIRGSAGVIKGSMGSETRSPPAAVIAGEHIRFININALGIVPPACH